MAIVRQQKASGATATGGTSLGVAWPAATTAGNLLVAVLVVRCYGGTVQPITPPAGWTQAIVNESDLGSSAVAIYYIQNAASRSGTETFAWTAADKGAALTLLEYSGMATSGVLDQVAGSPDESGVASAWTGTTAPTTQAEELWLAGLAHDNNEVFGAPTNGFTEIDQRTALGTGAAQPTQTAVEEQLVNATGAATTSAPITGATRLSTGAIATFRARVAAPPINTVAPAVTGIAQTGQTLTSSTGTWTGDDPITYTRQWQRNLVDIPSETGSTYLLAVADEGQSITCLVTATNAAGTDSARSNAVVPDPAPVAPTNTTPPAITGTPQVTRTLTASQGVWDGDTPMTFAYQWQGDGVDLPGATGSSYHLEATDEATLITVVVTATNVAGSTSAESDPVGPVTAAPPPPPPAGAGPPSVGRLGASNPGRPSAGPGVGVRTT